MSLDDVSELERLRQAWPDAEPPAALDGAVRLQAGRLLAGRRADLAVREEGSYPGWLLGLTAVGLAAVLLLLCRLPLRGSVWVVARGGLEPLPLAPAWLCLAASNLLAALVAPALAVWRRSHAR